jgi:hypothetical protein
MKLEELIKNYNNKEYKVTENMGNDILVKSPDFTRVKIIVIESLLNNTKVPEAMSFITSKVSNEEKNLNDEFNYYLAFACYLDSNYAKAKQIMNIIYKRNPDTEKYKKLHDILQVIETEKEKGKLYLILQLMKSSKKENMRRQLKPILVCWILTQKTKSSTHLSFQTELSVNLY